MERFWLPLCIALGFAMFSWGIENVLESDLKFLQASAKNTARTNGKNIGNATLQAIEYLHRNKMYVIGGLIVGSPNDTVESIQANLAFARQYVDWPYIQHPTPYPRTPMTDDFHRRGLIESERLEEYDGTTSVVRNEYLSADEIEYLRWKAERGMKTRHIPTVFRHDPWFVVRNAAKMAAHTYRGSTLRTVLGLEDERQAFVRYKEIRRQERQYL
jgi:anaerobic magnesium-protoporphyrin IX monomethyl ester cyclase